MFLKTIKSNIEKAISLTDSDSFYISCNINVDREVTDIYGVKKKVSLPQKYIFMYSKKYERREKYINDEKIENAMDIINKSSRKKVIKTDNKLINISASFTDEDTGEIIESIIERELNKKEIEKLREYEGYSLIISSETDMKDTEIIRAYKNQYLIEQGFRITKTDIQSRPTYLNKEEHLEAHFLTCFIALVYIRVLQKILNNKYSAKKIIDKLKEYKYKNIKGNIYQVDKINEMILELNKYFNINTDYEILIPSQIREFFKKSKLKK